MIVESVRVRLCSGNIAWIPFEPAAAESWKPRTPPFQVKFEKLERSLPSVHVSICFADTTGMPCDWAAATTASDSGCDPWSVWKLVVKTP